MSDRPGGTAAPRSSAALPSVRNTLSRRRLLLAGATAAGLAIGAADSAQASFGAGRGFGRGQDAPRDGGSLTVGLQSEPDTLDPHVTPYAVSHNVMMNVFDTLVWQDPADGSFKPGLATAWEASTDGLEYRFTLRQGVTFHDGTPFDASAVAFSFDRIVDPATKSAYAASLLGPYAGSEVVDPATVLARFSEPYAPLLDSLSQAFLGIVSPTAVAQLGNDAFGQQPVGTGPFVFSEWITGDHITLARNPNYQWAGGVFAHQGPAYLDEIVFRIIPEDSTRTGTLESGETTLIELVPEGDISLLEGEGFTFVAGNAPGVPSVVMLNTAKAPIDDPAVRTAIVLGTNKQTIIDAVYFGVYQRAYGPLSKASWAYDGEFEALDAYDPERANQLLEDAGWTLDGDIRKKGGQPLELLFIISNWQIYAELWQSQMRDLGIDLKIQHVDPSAELDMLIQGQSHVSAIEWISSDPGILEYLFHSANIGTGFAWSRYRDSQLDALLEQGRRTLDRETRKQLYADAQRIIMQQALIVPLFEQTAYNGIGKHLHDVKVDARGWYRWLYDAWLDE